MKGDAEREDDDEGEEEDEGDEDGGCFRAAKYQSGKCSTAASSCWPREMEMASVMTDTRQIAL